MQTVANDMCLPNLLLQVIMYTPETETLLISIVVLVQ